MLRNLDGFIVTADDVSGLANWNAKAPEPVEIPFVVARVVLQDFTGVPLLADLAAMRNVAEKMGRDPKRIEPLVPVDLVVDHSVMIDHFGSKKALDLNMKLEFSRNQERYQFMKWGMDAFDTFEDEQQENFQPAVWICFANLFVFCVGEAFGWVDLLGLAAFASMMAVLIVVAVVQLGIVYYLNKGHEIENLAVKDEVAPDFRAD